MKKVTLLASPNNDAQKAVQRPPLGDEILAFAYSAPTRRLLSTFFCPPLRIVAIDTEKRIAVYDRIVQSSRVVVLPPAQLVLEMDPGMDYVDVLPEILAGLRVDSGEMKREAAAEVSASALIFALFADALADLRRVKANCMEAGEVKASKLKSRFEPWERGKIVGSAGFVIDYTPTVTWRIPDGAIELSHEILYIEREYHDELLAASIAGAPWQKDLSNKCLGCGKGASWRFALPVPDGMPVEIAWRLQRPENAVPLCHDCVETSKFSDGPDSRRNLVWALWGLRFDALERWYLAVQNLEGYRFPKDWSKERFPLWPKEFGGRDWASGSGAAEHCGPREPKHVRRKSKQQKALSIFGIRI